MGVRGEGWKGRVVKQVAIEVGRERSAKRGWGVRRRPRFLAVVGAARGGRRSAAAHSPAPPHPPLSTTALNDRKTTAITALSAPPPLYPSIRPFPLTGSPRSRSP